MKSGPGGCRFQAGEHFGDAFPLFFIERLQREARKAAAVAAQIHDVLEAGDAGFGDDSFRSANQNSL